VARDKAKARMKSAAAGRNRSVRSPASEKQPKRKPANQAQLTLGDL